MKSQQIPSIRETWGGNTSTLPYDVGFSVKLLSAYNRNEFLHMWLQGSHECGLYVIACKQFQSTVGCEMEKYHQILEVLLVRIKPTVLQSWFGQSA